MQRKRSLVRVRHSPVSGYTPADGFAYPFGNYNAIVEDLVGNAGFVNARTVDIGYNDTATNPLQIKTYSVVASTTLAQVESWVNTAKANNWWLVLTFHDIDPATVLAQNEETYGTTPDELQQIVTYLKSQDVQIKTMDQAIAILENSSSTGGTGGTGGSGGGSGGSTPPPPTATSTLNVIVNVYGGGPAQSGRCYCERFRAFHGRRGSTVL